MPVKSGQPAVIAIDGPSGSGKGTICQIVASKLGWHLLDSGALYRLVALKASLEAIALDNDKELALAARDLDVRFVPGEGNAEQQVILDGEDVSLMIRNDEIGQMASKVAAVEPVRAALLQRQRDFCEAPGLVADGRDMGSVVFPDAPVKIFLTASAEERAKRRHKQLKEKGLDGNLAALLRSIIERDERDQNRSVAPLVPASDAFVIDGSDLSIDEVVTQVFEIVEERLTLSQ